MFHSKTFLVILLGLITFAKSQHAFSLSGPLAPWQTAALGYAAPIPNTNGGGPMNLDEEYRWNVPTVHYGFTADFLNFFGVRGAEEIEKAIAVLNDLPEADNIVIDDYPLESVRVNHRAQALGIVDLKTRALQILTTSMGLADPIRYAYTLRNRWVDNNITNYLVTMRNFDPETWDYSPFVNGTLYTYQVIDPFEGIALALNTAVDPLDQLFARTRPVSAVSSLTTEEMPAGGFLTGLTRDDVAGLKYIYRSSNYNTETALGDISGAGGGLLGGGGGGGSGLADFPGIVTSPGGGTYDFPFLIATNTVAGGGGNLGGQATATNAFINPALRAGKNKITFLRSDYDSLIGAFFQPFTVRFSETVRTNDLVRSQSLIRTVIEPDYIFDAADLQGADAFAGGPVGVQQTLNAGWLSSDEFDGVTGDDAGPGIITPSTRITFNNVGPLFLNQQGAGVFFLREGDINTTPIFAWGSFDGTTNAPIVYPDKVTIEDLERLVR